MRHYGFLCLALCSWAWAGLGMGLGANASPVTIEGNVSAKMRDGVILKADVYRPKATGKFPVILMRSPYNKQLNPGWAVEFAAQGYVAIIQDVRGRYASEGDWYPFKYESQDGYDTVEWAAALPYSNGKVALFGGSYVGITVLLAALAEPPHLAAMFYVESPADLYEGFIYRGGEFEEYLGESWTTLVAQDALDRDLKKGSHVMDWMKDLPLGQYPVLPIIVGPGFPPANAYAGGAAAGRPAETLAPYFTDWLEHPTDDDYWKRWSLEGQYGKIKVPCFHMAAWYDLFLGGVLDNYRGMKEHGGSEAARKGQRLLILPWTHGQFAGPTGEVNFFHDGYHLDLTDLSLRWFNHVLKGMPDEMEKEKPVKIFVMGKNIWREEDDWPPARAHATPFYLHSQGQANSATGDGTVSTTLPAAEPADRFVYDPAEPVPTLGGGLCCGPLMPGVRDQRPVEARDDVLVYTTPAFQADFEVTGPLRLELYASSSAVDTDFTAKLVDVWPNGFAQNLTSGILRAKLRNSLEKPEFMTPGDMYKFSIDMWSTSNVFLPGHRLRLEISSSNFPHYARNLNSGEPLATGTRMVKAANRIYHDQKHPSALILPVVP
jgi:uncharacterized protein